MFQEATMTEPDFGQIRAAVLRTLEKVGMMFQSETLLAALAKAGATVDTAQERAWLPRAMVEEVIEAAKAQAPADRASPQNHMTAPGLPGIGCQVAQFYLDWAAQERRAGSRADLIRMIKLGDVLAERSSVGHALLMTDVPAMIEPLEACALLCEYAHTPGYTYPHYAEQFDYLMEMGEIVDGDRTRFLIGGVFITSPLRLCERAAEFMARRLAMGMECNASTMACVGASVPVTMAGAIAVSAAEILGCWTAVRAMRPEATLSSGIAAGSLDMRNGNATYCSPEAMRLNFGVAEFFRRLCGKRIGIAGASDYCDSKFPGVAAAMEKAFKAMTVAAFTGVQPPAGQGMLESGKTLCPEQLIIERELTQHLQALAQPLAVDPDTLAVDTVEEVGLGLNRSYIDCDHTFAHFRAALWHPALLDRGVWQGFEAQSAKERHIVDKAHEVVVAKIEEYRRPEVDTDKLRAIRAVVDRAKADFREKS